jgi:hypothetical protein
MWLMQRYASGVSTPTSANFWHIERLMVHPINTGDGSTGMHGVIGSQGAIVSVGAVFRPDLLPPAVKIGRKRCKSVGVQKAKMVHCPGTKMHVCAAHQIDLGRSADR